MPDDIFKKLNNLPDKVKEYTYSEELADRNLQIIEKYKLSENQQEEFFNILNRIFVRDTSPDALENSLKGNLKLEDDKVITNLANDIRKKILAPIADYLGGSLRKTVEKKEDNTLIQKAVQKFGLKFENSDLKERFLDICESFLENARTEAQFRNTLAKPAENGGMGYEKAQAEQIAKFFASYLRIGELEKKKEIEKKIPEKKRVKNLQSSATEKEAFPTAPPKVLSEKISSPPVEPPSAPVAPSDEVSFETEEREAEQMKQKVEDLKASAPKTSPVDKVDKALEEINIQFPSSELKERLRKAIEARLRNVRTAIQTFERLTMPVNRGGLGLSKEEADDISLILNDYIEGEDKDLYKSKISEVKEFEKKAKAQSKEREQKEQSRQKEILNKKFEKLTAGKKSKSKKSKKVKPVMPKAETTAKTPSRFSKEFKKETKNSAPIIKEAPKKIAPKMPEEKKEKLASEPRGLKPKPVLEDIKATPRLYGPVQEIGDMTLENFRGLSKDAKEAMAKIKDKLAILRDESYQKYEQAVNAWKNSPVYKEYLSVLNASLQELKPPEEIIKSKKTLTQEEFDVIMEEKIEE